MNVNYSFSTKKLSGLLAVLSLIIPVAASAIEAGAAVPNCNLKNMADGSPLLLSKPGKVVYVDFWASWCGPCAQSMPFLNAVNEHYKDKGLEIIAVNLDENREDADGFLKNHPVTVTLASNEDGQCPISFGVQAMPSSYIIDKQGKVRHIQLGFHSSEASEIKEKIQALLQE